MIRMTDALTRNRNRIANKTDEGFTLIELLVVVIIIGILAAIAIPIYIGVQNNAKDSAVQSDLSNLKTALVAHYTSNGEYPTDLTSIASDGYTVPSLSNYADAADQPFVFFAADGTSFCVGATSITTNSFGASDSSGIAKGTCATGGIFTPAP